MVTRKTTSNVRANALRHGWRSGLEEKVANALTEAGIFNASSAGTLLCRTVFSVVTKGASDAMTITWTVTLS